MDEFAKLKSIIEYSYCSLEMYRPGTEFAPAVHAPPSNSLQSHIVRRYVLFSIWAVLHIDLLRKCLLVSNVLLRIIQLRTT